MRIGQAERYSTNRQKGRSADKLQPIIYGVRYFYMDKQPGGWIYILISSSDYTRCKIGKSENNPLIRYKNLRTADPTLALKVAYYIPERFGPISGYEAAIHSAFHCVRMETHDDTTSEWFRIEANQAEFDIDCLLEEWTKQTDIMSTTFNCDALIKMYADDINSAYNPDLHEKAFINEILLANGPSPHG